MIIDYLFEIGLLWFSVFFRDKKKAWNTGL